MINKSAFELQNVPFFKEQMLHWSSQFGICSLFDSHEYSDQYQSFDCIMAIGCIEQLVLNNADYLMVKRFIHQKKRWLFGHVSYEFYPNSKDSSSDNDAIGFPLLHLYEPEMIIQIKANEVTITSHCISPKDIFDAIISCPKRLHHNLSVDTQPILSKEAYIAIIKQLQEHILRGDCYEINFCQAFIGQAANMIPEQVYLQLENISPTPFSCYYKLDQRYLMCSSPERFLKKKGNKLIAQPIKGTTVRNKQDNAVDDSLKQDLYNSSKERSENVMIVDLMRNDLSKIATEGSVKVEELFGIYSFPQVHQMISTIVCEVKEDIDFADILEAMFPMGSMTGAPKKKVMELIELYEPINRGLYSGSVGYINPEGDFDFNVVIRSILYNEASNQVSYHVGSGITFYSDPEKEYEECLIKAIGMQKALSNQVK